MASKSSDALKVPPHDIEAEKSVLGAVLIDSSTISQVFEFLRSEHFYIKEHQYIYSAMLTLFEKQEPIDLVTLKNALKKSGNLKKVGGTEFLSDLINTVPTAAYAEHYAHIVKDNYTKRKLIELSSRLVEQSFNEQGDTKNLLDDAERQIFALSQEHHHQDFAELKEILADSFERLDEFIKSGTHIRGVATGFSTIDNKIAGLHDSNLIVLAARPGIGKTTLALNIALNVAMKDKIAVGYFSLEMSKEELVDRLLVGQADIDAWRLKTGRLSDEDFKKLTEAMGELSEAPIYIDDSPGISVLEMRTKARKLKVDKNLRLLIVDYLQLADSGKKFDSRVQEVSYISQGLKNLARELKIPVIAVSQLSRAVEQRGTKKPQLADLRESGAIEQDADIVAFLYQEESSEDLIEQDKRLVKLYIAKHRNGPTGEVDLMFKADRVKFYSVESSSK
ncbi:replicative DNA helicase [Candidatus Roizmanbacteria bacterium RIFCSPHIGHO2_12_FULL_33_9]|uniref:Replicative DNA helicase n=1 Tax=Candidatus Roizmanbacteria bacterium RIFCSPHIGHO2_12_FULL_33_9 TaxID=1802045 RepID=A0A1F7HIB0_9BACT|nr:MAG: replicative DNA helicase [Candidatus Roizmanbacteria bacterium RIFCSPHIGHO2_12_FULL_33_9]